LDRDTELRLLPAADSDLADASLANKPAKLRDATINALSKILFFIVSFLV